MSDKKNKGGLGRGLGALIPTGGPREPLADASDSSDAARDDRGQSTGWGQGDRSDDGQDHGEALAPVGAHFREVPLDAVSPNPRQPRTVFDEDALAELVASIHEVGLLQPIVVRELDRVDGDDRYELVMGERRLRAARQAGLETIPAIVRETPDTELLRDALLENLHRAQLNPLEEASAYSQLLEDFSCTHEDLASRVGKSRSHVSNTIRLLGLPPAVQRRVAAGVLSAGHARALLALDDPEAQDRLAQRIVAEGLSVRAVEEIVAVGETGGAAPRKRRTPRAGAPGLGDLADRLSDRFETRVRVDLGRTKGKIVVEFASVDDLERIVASMAPELGAVIPQLTREATDFTE